MRKKEKRQILSLLNTMRKANAQLAVLNRENKTNDLMTILADEQEVAISIGNRIEEFVGEDSEVVSILEEYCEFLWKITQDNTVNQINRDIEQLGLLLNRCIKEVESLKESERIDVVFLPYNASMWDCMETVWRAAYNDPICNVYVIPIPYFEINSDESLGKMHYEGENFPKEVQITSYQEYDIRKQHPDIIYIHNPYDEYNKVTRVHSDYYSSVLKKYTDILVYIPYFIANEKMPESHSYLPAYIYADKIILQTQRMIDDIHPSIPKDKLLPLGSPKAERIIWMETHKEQIGFPDEWKKKATGKKVVFFNVSISAVLKYREKMLDKIEEVFGIANSYNNIVLLWRPHPLLEATLASMCDDLVERYHRLMRWYRKKNIGILDKSPDPDMAVAFSDAYIGESSSSIVNLFRTVNKNRLLINEKQFYQPSIDEMHSETTYDICRVGNDLWFVTCQLQMLCKYNINSRKVEIVAEVPETKDMSYVYISYHEGKIILIPGHEAAICIYDIERKSFTKKYFEDKYVNYCFGRGIVIRQYLYLSPIDYPALIRYNLYTEEFEYFEQCITDMLNETASNKKNYPFLWAVSGVGTEIYIASMCSNRVLVFNTDMLSYQIVEVGGISNTYRDMVSDETYTWLIHSSKPLVVRWNRQTNEVTEYKEFPKDFVSGKVPFASILDFGDMLYLAPYHANRMCCLDKNTGIISYPKRNLQFKKEMHSVFYLFAKKISDIEMMAMSPHGEQLVVINIQTGESQYIPLRIEDHIYWELRKNGFNLAELWESEIMPLSKYFECISLGLEHKLYRKGILKPEMDTDRHVGEEVHQIIKTFL